MELDFTPHGNNVRHTSRFSSRVAQSLLMAETFSTGCPDMQKHVYNRAWIHPGILCCLSRREKVQRQLTMSKAILSVQRLS